MAFGGTADETEARPRRSAGLFADDLGLFVEVGAEGEALDEHAEDVLDGEVGFLDVRRDS